MDESEKTIISLKEVQWTGNIGRHRGRRTRCHVYRIICLASVVWHASLWLMYVYCGVCIVGNWTFRWQTSLLTTSLLTRHVADNSQDECSCWRCCSLVSKISCQQTDCQQTSRKLHCVCCIPLWLISEYISMLCVSNVCLCGWYAYVVYVYVVCQ